MRRLLVALPLLALAATALSADPKPEDVVTYRQTVMSGLGKHMKASSFVVKGKIARPGDLVGHATALHAGSQGLLELFPAGTGPDATKTEAKAEIWTDWAKFEAAAKAFETETAALVEVAKGGDLAAFTAQYGKVGESCGGCHDAFKVKDE